MKHAREVSAAFKADGQRDGGHGILGFQQERFAPGQPVIGEKAHRRGLYAGVEAAQRLAFAHAGGACDVGERDPLGVMRLDKPYHALQAGLQHRVFRGARLAKALPGMRGERRPQRAALRLEVERAQRAVGLRGLEDPAQPVQHRVSGVGSAGQGDKTAAGIQHGQDMLPENEGIPLGEELRRKKDIRHPPLRGRFKPVDGAAVDEQHAALHRLLPLHRTGAGAGDQPDRLRALRPFRRYPVAGHIQQGVLRPAGRRHGYVRAAGARGRFGMHSRPDRGGHRLEPVRG